MFPVPESELWDEVFRPYVSPIIRERDTLPSSHRTLIEGECIGLETQSEERSTGEEQQ